MRVYWLILGILAVWRVTHLLAAEDGPWNVMARLRRRAGNGVIGELLDCFYCLSLWVALPAGWWIGETWMERAMLWLAVSGGAIVVERTTARDASVPPLASYHEDPGDDRGMLRKE